MQRQKGQGGLFQELVGLQLYLLQFLVGPGLVPLCQVGHTQRRCLCHLRTEITEHCHFGLQDSLRIEVALCKRVKAVC